MTGGVTVRTDGDSLASLDHGRVLVEFSKDGDSPRCPDSWTWVLWIDGEYIDSCVDEAPLASAVDDAVRAILAVMSELHVLADYLEAFGAFGKKDE